MRAAVLSEAHSFDVEELSEPEPRAGELVLRVRACGICGSDLKAYQAMPAGAVLGHEFCGDVVAVGTGVDRSWNGKTVAAMPLGACGRCRWCLADEPAHCERVDLIGVGGSGGAFAEYVRVPVDSAVALAEGVGRYGALVEPLAVGLHVVNEAGIRTGDRVLVLGGGSVGAAVTLWARRFAAAEVVVSDPVADRRDSAATFGATGAHDPAEGPPPSGFDVVIECVGAPGLVQTAIDAAAVRGRVVVAGVCMAPDPIVPVIGVMKEVELRFAVYYRQAEFAAAASLVGSAAFDPAAFVSSTVGLEALNDAFNRLKSTVTERKVLVLPNG